MLFIKFITVVAFAVLGIEVFVGKVLSCKMNLFVDIFELLFGIFHLFTSVLLFEHRLRSAVL